MSLVTAVYNVDGHSERDIGFCAVLRRLVKRRVSACVISNLP